MKITISDKRKKEIFISLFNVLKNCSSLINLSIFNDFLHIQGMDKSHICLYDVKISNLWFNEYHIESEYKICFDSSIFYSIISTKNDNQQIMITMNNKEQDFLHIYFGSNEVKKGDFKKTFKMPLCEYDYEEMNIPETEYDTEFSIQSKQITDIFTQLGNFGNDIVINCNEENIYMITDGTSGEMRVDIAIDDLNSFSIVEGEKVSLTYSIAYMNKMCITNKLSSDIDFYLSNERPMKINYNLGDDSYIVFFIAPKLND